MLCGRLPFDTKLLEWSCLGGEADLRATDLTRARPCVSLPRPGRGISGEGVRGPLVASAAHAYSGSSCWVRPFLRKRRCCCRCPTEASWLCRRPPPAELSSCSKRFACFTPRAQSRADIPGRSSRCPASCDIPNQPVRRSTDCLQQVDGLPSALLYVHHHVAKGTAAAVAAAAAAVAAAADPPRSFTNAVPCVTVLVRRYRGEMEPPPLPPSRHAARARRHDVAAAAAAAAAEPPNEAPTVAFSNL
jgi:hypothetical protein